MLERYTICLGNIPVDRKCAKLLIKSSFELTCIVGFLCSYGVSGVLAAVSVEAFLSGSEGAIPVPGNVWGSLREQPVFSGSCFTRRKKPLIFGGETRAENYVCARRLRLG